MGEGKAGGKVRMEPNRARPEKHRKTSRKTSFRSSSVVGWPATVLVFRPLSRSDADAPLILGIPADQMPFLGNKFIEKWHIDIDGWRKRDPSETFRFAMGSVL